MSYADQIRTEANLKNMRSLIASGIEENKSIADAAKTTADEAKSKVDLNENRVNNLVNAPSGKDLEVQDIRYDPINNIQYPTAAGRLNKINSDLNDMTTIQTFYNKSKFGKKIVMVGDSTTEVAPEMYNRFAEYVKTGGLLEGATVINRGSNGNTLDEFVRNITNNGNGNAIERVISEKADLYVLSYGINDIRGGISSPGRTKDQVKTDLKTAIDRLLNETNGYVLLRIPNTFIQDNTASTYFDDSNKAQLYSDQLYEIYESFRGYNKKVDVIDIPNLIFGKKVLTQHPYMLNGLHPNDNGYRAICDTITEHITNAYKDTKLNIDELIFKGTIESGTSSILTVATSSKEKINIGDVVLIGNSTSFVIKTAPKYLNNKWEIPHENINYLKYGVIRIVRKVRKKGVITTENNLNNDWIKASVQPNSGTVRYFTTVIDLSPYSLTGNINFDLTYDYYTTTENISSINTGFWLNNNPTYSNITGGTQKDSIFIKPTFGEVSSFGDRISVDVTNNRYLHLLMSMDAPTNVVAEMEIGNLKLLVNNIKINTNNLVWQTYNAAAISKVIPTVEREIISTKKYVDELPKVLGISNLTNNWHNGKVNKSSNGSIYNRFVIDISSYGITTAQDFTVKFKYYTKDNRISGVLANIWLNNSTSVITGGINGSTPFAYASYDSTTQYEGKINLNSNTYQYVHLLVEIGASSGQGINYEIGELELLIGNQVINLSGITPTLYNQETSSVLLTNCYKGDAYMLYRDFISELRKLGILTS